MSRALLASLVLVGTALTACPEKPIVEPPPPPPVEDAGVEDAGVEDAGFDAGFKCRIDDDCAVFNDGSRCVTESDPDAGVEVGTCIPASTCTPGDDSSCAEYDDETDYCYSYNGVGCRCVEENGQGICRRRRPACEPCTDDTQCGSNASLFDPKGSCVPFPNENSETKYCFQAAIPVGSGQQPFCEPGYVQDEDGFCKPQLSCENPGCRTDADCPSNNVCNASAPGQIGVCEQPCFWNFQANDERAPGCPSGKVCWMDVENLDPNSPIWGRGRCRAPCTDDTQCTDTTINSHGGPQLECAAEVSPYENPKPASAQRCRARGECRSDDQCAPLTSPSSNGYCDRATFTCKTDCRTGIDPTTGTPFGKGPISDCKTAYVCTETSPGVRSCELEPCKVEGRGAICRPNQFCCGEDKNRDGTADACTDLMGNPVSQDPDSCYDAPSPFCDQCDGNLPWTACPATPQYGDLPTLCTPPAMGAPAMCLPGTYNDQILEQTVCPNGWNPQRLYVDCASDADCRKGNTTGTCAPDQKRPDPENEGQFLKSCMCGNPGSPGGDCPEREPGKPTYCLDGVMGSEQSCILSTVCVPGVDTLTNSCGIAPPPP